MTIRGLFPPWAFSGKDRSATPELRAALLFLCVALQKAYLPPRPELEPLRVLDEDEPLLELPLRVLDEPLVVVPVEVPLLLLGRLTLLLPVLPLDDPLVVVPAEVPLLLLGRLTLLLPVLPLDDPLFVVPVEVPLLLFGAAWFPLGAGGLVPPLLPLPLPWLMLPALGFGLTVAFGTVDEPSVAEPVGVPLGAGGATLWVAG